MRHVPGIRVREVNDRLERPEGRYVVYWMTAFRRLASNFALQRAAERARALGRPLLIFEGLRCDYEYASDRHHSFILDGMREHAAKLPAEGPVAYFPWIESSSDEGRGLLEALTAEACLVVTDDWPGFFVPRMVAAAARKLDVRLEAVDANGLLPLRAADRTFPTAYAFRRFLQKTLPAHLGDRPLEDPLARLELPRLDRLPDGVTERWTSARQRLSAGRAALADLPIDHDVAPVDHPGGTGAGLRRLADFLEGDLSRYGERRNEPQADAASRLSPYLHFGHVGTHQVLAALAEREEWAPEDVADRADGKRTGWWRTSPPAEAFLDQLVTWRELGLNMAWREPDADDYDTLPDWARETLDDHDQDTRPWLYDRDELAAGRTHDPLWNAAQGQLLAEGRIHNYLRMLWGKKILHWTRSPREALRVMLELNDRYALDGRDPNSVSGIFWCLGRYDRPWGPERPVFGKIRYMTSDSTRRKYDVEEYVRRWAP